MEFHLRKQMVEIARTEGLRGEICNLVFGGSMANDNEAFGDLITNNMEVNFQVFHTFMEY